MVMFRFMSTARYCCSTSLGIVRNWSGIFVAIHEKLSLIIDCCVIRHRFKVIVVDVREPERDKIENICKLNNN